MNEMKYFMIIKIVASAKRTLFFFAIFNKFKQSLHLVIRACLLLHLISFLMLKGNICNVIC